MKKKLDIIFENKELLIINKPAKILTIATEKEQEHTLYHQAREYIKKQNPKNKIFIVHRLDRETSGIVVFAKNEKIKHELQENWNQKVKREYLAIVEGIVIPKKQTIINYLQESKTLQVYDTKNPKIGKKAITTYQVLQEKNNKSLLKITIQTGRKNQIRVALASINHPIIGDKKYHSKQNTYNRLALHASKITFQNEKEHTFRAKVPKEWEEEFPKGIKKYEEETND